jgi:hypothetical protein
MYFWFLRLTLRSFLGALIGSFMFVSAGVAQQSPTQLESNQQQFLANPGQFLAQNFINGGNDLALMIRSIAVNPGNLQIVINALANANPSQQTAIGSGLGQAALASMRTNPSYANQIQTAVAASGSSRTAAGYSSASGGTQIGSTGSGAARNGGGGRSFGAGTLTGGTSGNSAGSSTITGGTSVTSTQSASFSGGIRDIGSSSTGGTSGTSDQSSSLTGGTGGNVTGATGGVAESISPH